MKQGKIKRSYVSIVLLLFFTCVFQQCLLLGQNPSLEYKLNKRFFIKFSDDVRETLVSPRNWDGKDLLTFSAVLGTGILFYAFDQEINDWLQDNRTSFSDDFFKVATDIGHGAFLAGLMTAMYASGELFKSNSLRKTALLSLESFVISGVLVLGLKFSTGRARPQMGKSKNTFHLFSTRSSYNSFPSGHASSAFAVATTVAEQSDKTVIDILAYSLATVVAVSRIHNSKHWASDALVGSAIGYFVAKKISGLNRDHNSTALKVNFYFNKDRQAISFCLFF
ncbi:MAG: phosphatase PAP2 family protein [Candidatus Aminicenantaceae bacterium]